jgi:hypothetical protein
MFLILFKYKIKIMEKPINISKIINNINKYRQQNKSNNTKVYPYYINITNAIINGLSIKYFINLSFYALMFSYLTQAYKLVDVLIPINICNVIIYTLVIIIDSKEVILDTLGNNKFKKLSKDTRSKIINNDEDISKYYIFSSLIYYLFILIITLIINHNIQKTDQDYLSLFGLNLLLFIGFILVSRINIFTTQKEEFYIILYISLLFTLTYILNN